MKRTLIALALIASPAAVDAQSVALAGSGRASASVPAERPRLSPAARARIEERITAAAARGIPAEPMRRLAAEGEAKFASETRINLALARLEANLQTARSAFVNVGRTPSDGEMIAGAEAISQGVSEAQLRGVIKSAPAKRPLEVALTTLSVLTVSGEGVAKAVAIVESQLAARASDADIASSAGIVVDDAAGKMSAVGANAAGAVTGTAGAAGVGAAGSVTGAVSGTAPVGLGRRP